VNFGAKGDNMKTTKKKTALQKLDVLISYMEMNLEYYKKHGNCPSREQYLSDLNNLKQLSREFKPNDKELTWK
jgi:exo-beta-1,3-glucanase (GH17 family)